jgi:hypothetical protein
MINSTMGSTISSELKEFIIDIRDTDQETKQKAEGGSGSLQGRTVKPIDAPQTIEQALIVLRTAELASNHKDLSGLKACDQALSTFLKKEKEAICFDWKSVEIGLRVLRLDLPNTKQEMLAQCQKTGLEFHIDDKNPSFSDALEGRLSDLMFNNMQERYPYIADSCKELAEKMLASYKESKKQGYTISDRGMFCFLLYLLKHPEYDQLLNLIFYTLSEYAIEEKLPADLWTDFIKLSLHHPKLQTRLGEGKDKVVLKVIDVKNKTLDSIPASRLLLSYGSEYFRELVKKKSLDEGQSPLYALSPETPPTIDFCGTEFDKEIIETLTQWLRNPYQTSFSANSEADTKPWEKLKRFLTHIPAFTLRDQNLFLEMIQLELARVINDESIADIVQMSMQYKLEMTLILCILHINSHPSQGFHIEFIDDAPFIITQKAGAHIPTELYKAVDFSKKRIDCAVIEDSEPEDVQRGCLSSLLRFGKKSVSVGQGVWNSMGIEPRRVALCYLTLMGMQQSGYMESSTELINFILSYQLSVNVPNLVAVVFPLLNARFSRRPRVISLTNIVPGFIQRGLIGCSSKINGFISKYFAKKSPRSEQQPLLSNGAMQGVPLLSKSLPQLDLSNAHDLTDEAFGKLASMYPDIEVLVLSSLPLLTEAGFAHIKSLKKLSTLKIIIPNNNSPGSLNKMNLKNLLDDMKNIVIEVSVSDFTVAYHSIRFLHELPKNVEVRINLEHVDIISSTVFLESSDGLSKTYNAYHELFTRLTESCPRMTHLDCQEVSGMTDNDLEIIAKNCLELRSLTFNGGTSVTDDGIRALVNGCRETLEEIHIGGTNRITNRSIEILANECPHLKKFALFACHGITDEGIAHLLNAKNLASCYLHHLHGITDVAIRSLKNKFPKLDFFVKYCPQVTFETLSTLTQSSEIDKKQMAFAQRKFAILKASAMPLIISKKFLSPVIFRFLVDNMNVQFNHPIAELVAKYFREGLGIAARKDVLYHPAQMSTLAKLPHDIIAGLMSSRHFFSKKPLPISYDIYFHNITEMLIKHFLLNLSSDCFSEIENLYKKFLQDNYPSKFVRDVEAIYTGMNISIKKIFSVKTTRNDVRRVFEELFEIHNPQAISAFVPLTKYIIDGSLKGIKNIGNRIGWDEEQKKAAFLRFVFSDWSWFADMLVDRKPPATVNDEETEDSVKSLDEKEHKEHKESQPERKE